MPDQPTRTDSPVVPAQRQPESARIDPEMQQRLADRRAQLETQQRLGELRAEGHGPQRHHDPNDQQLTARLGTPKTDAAGNVVTTGDGFVVSENKIDPMTGTTTDGVTGNAHRCGRIASKFDSGADYVAAENYLKQRVPENGVPVARAPISDILGSDGHQRISGVYLDPQNPGQVKRADFEGGEVIALYKRETDGSLKLRTMYADPAPFRPETSDGES